MKVVFASFILFFSTTLIYPKVLIFTYAFNRPDFIEIQHKTFEHFIEDEYEFVVFSDARTAGDANAIKNTCDRLGIKHVRIPQNIHSKPYLERWPGENYHAPAVRNVNAVMYSLNTLGFDHDDILVLLDSDVFFLKKICIRDLLKDYNIVAQRIGSGYIIYPWHGLIFMDMKTLPDIRSLNFNCGRVNDKPVDAGGQSYYYLHAHPEVTVRYLQYFHAGQLYCDNCKKNRAAMCTHNYDFLNSKGFSDAFIKLMHSAQNIEFFHNQNIIHYRGGTNWDNKSKQYHTNKTEALNAYIDYAITEQKRNAA